MIESPLDSVEFEHNRDTDESNFLVLLIDRVSSKDSENFIELRLNDNVIVRMLLLNWRKEFGEEIAGFVLGSFTLELPFRVKDILIRNDAMHWFQLVQATTINDGILIRTAAGVFESITQIDTESKFIVFCILRKAMTMRPEPERMVIPYATSNIATTEPLIFVVREFFLRCA